MAIAACQDDGASLLFLLAPSVVTICLLAVWGGIGAYIEKEISSMAREVKLGQEQVEYVVAIARSSIVIQNFIAAVVNSLVSVLVVIASFPEWTNRMKIAVPLVAALIIFFVRWITKVISFKLHELDETYVPYSLMFRKWYGKKRRKMTYAKLLTYHELALVGIVAVAVGVGYALTRCEW